ncbi:MAG TPA: RNA polymerase subunit sigma-70, partial [Verrucomicrobiota bacterium]|nr:RNA polymerase subunit sigma-70 [Verrucomicrobiota bacterium]
LFSDELVNLVATACDEAAPEIERRGRALRECLKLLQGHATELLRLRYEETLEPAAIAGRIRMAVGAVRVALSRTRASLRECIERRLKAEEARP